MVNDLLSNRKWRSFLAGWVFFLCLPVSSWSSCAICDDFLNISLNNTGTAILYAQTFWEGSSSCCVSSLQIKRTSDPDYAYGPYILFDCDDLGTVSVSLKVTDCYGYSNVCWGQVLIEDKIAPHIYCPHTITVDCADYYGDAPPPNMYPTVNEGCTVVSTTYWDNDFLGSCGNGYVSRTWTVVDQSGNHSSCVQTIYVEDNTPVVVYFPPDTTIVGCVSPNQVDPEDLPAPYDFPIAYGDDCELLAYNHEDLVFTTGGISCFKILRRWTVIDWCTYQVGGNQGYFQDTQIIKVKDDDAPTFTCPADMVVDLYGPDCLTTVQLPTLDDIDDCSNSIEVHIKGDLGEGYVFNNVAPGFYEMQYTVKDACNNVTTCDINITVEDAAAPGIICVNGLSMPLMETGESSIWASDFLVYASDNCTPDEDIQIQLGLEPAPGQNFPPGTTGLTFDCEDQGVNTVALWAGDAVGNWSYCLTYIIIQDSDDDLCDDGVMISGRIENEAGNMVNSVTVMLNQDSSYMMETATDGEFAFPFMPTGDDYIISPQKDIDLTEGLNTADVIRLLQHVNGNLPLESPYQIIAADVNHSDDVTIFDAIDLQRVILGVVDTFPNNTSWRFVDKSFLFPHPQAPFATPFPEVLERDNLMVNWTEANFIGIKIGDLVADPDSNSLQQDQVSARSSVPFVLLGEDRQLEAGSRVQLALRAGEATDLLGFQLGLEFDPTALQYVSWSAQNLPLETYNFGTAEIDQGRLSIGWSASHIEQLDQDASVVILEWQVLKNCLLSSVVQLAKEGLKAEAYDGAINKRSLHLLWESEVSSSAELEILAVMPNPFNEKTQIHYQLGNRGEVVLQLWDLSGRLIFQQRKDQEAGMQVWQLQRQQLPTTGTYFFSIQSKDTIKTGRVIFQD